MVVWRSGNDIASVAGSLGFHFWAGQIRRSIANGSEPLQKAYFFGVRSCVAQVLSWENGSRYSLHAWAEYGEYNEDLILICNKCMRKAKMLEITIGC